MNLRSRARLDRMVRLASAFAEAPSDEAPADSTLDLPEELSTLSDEELTALRDRAVEMFDELYADGEATLSPDDLETLKGLKGAIDSLNAEETRRSEASAEIKAAAAELAASIASAESAAGEEDAGGEEAPAEPIAAATETVALAGETVVDSGDAAGAVVAAAAAQRGPVSLRVSGARRRGAAAAKALAANSAGSRSPIRSTTAIGNFSVGQELSIEDLSEVYARQSGTLSKSAAESSVRSGRSFRQRFPIAQIRREFDERAKVYSDDPSDVEAAIKFATDEKRLSGGSLVAAGGWCAPSETIYDLCQLESSAGIISLPELGAMRGGIRNTLGPDWATFLSTTGFTFTEADDQAGNYSLSNEIQSLTEGGAGLTSFTLTYAGQTTAAITEPSSAASVQAALEALSNLAPGDVIVTGGGQPFVYQVEFAGTLAGTDVVTLTSTPTGGTGTVTVAVVQNGGAPGGGKPCNTIICPPFVDNRLDVSGVCVEAGILMDRSFPELIRRYVSGAITAHMHRVAANVIADIIAGSTAITMPSESAAKIGAAAPILSALELQIESIRSIYRMQPNASMEVKLPDWGRGLIRADLSRRLGVDLLDVSDQRINAWFTARGANVQWIYNFDSIGANPTTWPASIRALIYPAGTWVRLGGDLITLENLHDSTLNAANNYTAIFTEEAWGTMKTCHVSKVVTVPVCASGSVQGGVDMVCPSP